MRKIKTILYCEVWTDVHGLAYIAAIFVVRLTSVLPLGWAILFLLSTNIVSMWFPSSVSTIPRTPFLYNTHKQHNHAPVAMQQNTGSIMYIKRGTLLCSLNSVCYMHFLYTAEVWVGAKCCLKMPGLSRDIQHHAWHHTLSTGASPNHVKWAVSLVTAYGHFNLPQRFVWVYMGWHSHFHSQESLHHWITLRHAGTSKLFKYFKVITLLL